jgi:hypothetical protein
MKCSAESGNDATQDGVPPNSSVTDFVARLKHDDEINEMRAALDPRLHSYMRNAHLLPPREEFATWRWYVDVLKMFERAPTKLPMYRFRPTAEQRRLNAETLMAWDAARRSARGDPSKGRRKRALRLLQWRCFGPRRNKPALADVKEGERDDETLYARRYLAPLVNEGWLSRAELADAIVEASHRNGHIPDNKTVAQVERQIDGDIAKYTEPFDWERLDGDVR